MADWMSNLERANALLDAGVITPEEYEKEKARLLPISDSNLSRSEAVGSGPGYSSSLGGKLAGGAVAAALALGAAYFVLTEQSSLPAGAEQQRSDGVPAASPPPPAARATAETGQTVSRTERADEAGPCASNEFALSLGPNVRGGLIEILSGKADTDGMISHTFAATEVLCIPLDTLKRWEREAGGISEIDESQDKFLVTYDPKGSPNRFRSQLDYSVLMCDELAETPQPPPDIRAGEFVWASDRGIERARVRWYNDFRALQEDTCVR
jgi:hypothetical protein